MSDIIIDKVSKFITLHHLLKTDGKYLVALSGGADSVSLLLILHRLGFFIEAVHCNFHLRGDESDRDEAFCRQLCSRKKIPIHVVHFDTLSYSKLHKVSIEMAARDLRYAYFEQLRKDIGFDAICVAHHRDDNVETVLMNLMRGTGIKGLSGIHPRNGNIIRPLLCISREDVEEFLMVSNQDYVVDSTNLIDDALRNKIRLHVMPVLHQTYPSVSDNIAKTALKIAECQKIVERALDESVANVLLHHANNDISASISIEKLKKEVSPEYTLYHILNQYGFSPSQVECIFENIDGASGKTYTSSAYELAIDRGVIILQPLNKDTSKVMKVPECGNYVYSEKKKFSISIENIDKNFNITRDSHYANLDANKVSFPLTIRCVREGDRFSPLGMKGSKLLSDYMTDRKLSVFEKRRQLVITDAYGKIIWVVGERPDNHFRINENSESALIIHLQ